MYFRLSLFSFVFALAPVSAQTSILTCATSAVPPMVNAEGVAERTGDILLSCSGDQPGAQVAGNLIVSLSVNVTNGILADGSLDALLRVTTGGATTTMNARQYTANAVAFNGVIFNVAADGTAELRIVNLRGNASQLLAAANPSISASVSFSGAAGMAVTNSTLVVAVPARGLYASTTGALRCGPEGSPVPDVLTLTNLFGSGTVFTSTRISEGFASSFAAADDPPSFLARSGVRIIAKYSGLPNDARLFVPDAIAGSTADVPTSAGEFGTPAHGGQYTFGQNQLLLVRVNGADSNGAGGTPGAINLNGVSEIAVANGRAYVVYEVVDADPFTRESAQFPTFLGLPPKPDRAFESEFSVNFAAISTTATQSPAAWIPRFVETPPPADCSLVGDCGANYFPQIQLDATPIQLSLAAGQQATRYIPLRNAGAGVLRWNASAVYPAGAPSNWLRLDPASGVNNGTIRVEVNAAGLPLGTHQATVIIDGGPLAGTRTVPVALTVVVSNPVIRSVTSAADGREFNLVAGSLATIMGSGFAGQSAQVTFDGTPGTLLYRGADQINVTVPAAMADKTVAAVVVMVDGQSSTPATVRLAASAPAIFPGAVLNQDFGANSEARPAAAGSVIQIFATGLPASGVITARVHDVAIPVPQYGGPAPGLDGVQQVNVFVPAHLPAMQTYVYVCGGPTADQQVCSPAHPLWLTR